MLSKSSILIFIFFNFIFSLIILTSSLADLAPTREVFGLNGTWLCASSSVESPPETGWADVEVPSFVSWQMDKPYIWFLRTFTLPTGFNPQRVYLNFQGIKYASKVYLNGIFLGEHPDGFTPFELAVPAEVLKEENNELLIQVSDWRSAHIEPQRAVQDGVVDPSAQADSLIYPVGSQVSLFGIWQDVTLVIYPEVRIQDVFVKTSVRNGQIELEVTLENMTGQPQTVTLYNEVLDDTQVVLDFNPTPVSFGSDEKTKVITIEQTWTNPHLWSPDDPHLYHLQSRLSNGDELIVRFGFREFWIEGSEFYLNGKPIHLRATAVGMPGYFFGFSKEDALRDLNQAKEGNNVIMRLHAQPWPSGWYEAADEVGMLIVWESAYWCYGPNYRVEDAQFWSHFENHLQDQIRLCRNHPSIVIWSLENELLLTGGASRDGRATNADVELSNLREYVQTIDNTRPIMFEGDGDPKGVTDILNLHYPHEYPRWNLWPNEAWWLEFTNQIDMYPGQIDGWPLEKPLYIGEFLWVPWPGIPSPRSAEIEGSTIFYGDAIYRDPWGYHQRGKASAWGYQIEAYRALGVQGFCPWNIWNEAVERPNPLLYDLAQEKFAPNGLYLREKNQRFFSGDNIRRTAYLFNDLLQEANLTVAWELKISDTVRYSNSQVFILQPAEIKQFPIDFQTPMNEESAAVLSYSVERDGVPVFSYEEPIRLYPRQAIQIGATIYLYDLEGTTASVLDREGIHYLPIVLSDLTTITPESGLVIVGCDELVDGDGWKQIKDFAERGGRVLIFHQEQYPDISLLLLATGGATIAFPRRLSHPILAGINEDELRFWAPDNLVIDKPLTKPDFGLYKVLIDSGSAEGLKYVGLMEIEFGSGTLLLSQLDLLPKLEGEPAARKLFQNILDYLASYQPAPGRQLQLLQSNLEEQSAFQTIGFDIEELQAPVSSGGLIFANDELSPNSLSSLLEQVEQGSVLWLHKPNGNVLAELSNFGLQIPTQVSLPGLVTVTDESQTEGLTSYSLNWALPSFISDFAETIYAQADFSGAISIPYSGFTVTAGMSEVRSDHIALFTNGYLDTEIEIMEAGRYNLGLDAWGTPAEGEYPTVRVQLEGETLGTVTVSEARGIYYLTTKLPVGMYRLRLEFVNDLFAPPEDRNFFFYNLLIKEAMESNLIALTQPAALVEAPYGSGFLLLDGLNWEKSGAEARKQGFLVSLLANLGVKLEPPSAYIVLEAERMDIVSGVQVKKTESGVWFFTNGTIAAEVDFAEPGNYLFKVLAGGTPLGGVYPEFDLAIDGNVVGSRILTAEAEIYYFIEADVEAGLHQISISFVNDAYVPPEDRNLFVDRLVIEPAENQPPHCLMADVSGNGEVTAFDAPLILRAVVGSIPFPDNPDYPCFTLENADVSGNGSLSALDAAMILQYTVRLIDTFPAQQPKSKELAYRQFARQMFVDEISDDASVAQISNLAEMESPKQAKIESWATQLSISLDEASGVLAGELHIVKPATTRVQGITAHPNFMIESLERENELKLVFATAEPVNGKTTLAYITLDAPVDEQRKLDSLRYNFALVGAELNEGTIPVYWRETRWDEELQAGQDRQCPTQTEQFALQAQTGQSMLQPPQVTRTRWAVWFYSLNSTFEGKPIQVGDIVTAKDPDGVICGAYVVDREGGYGYMPVYGDDPRTFADEGATDGDELTFYINGKCAHPLGFDEPLWTVDVKRREVNLMTGGCLHLSGEVFINNQSAPIGTVVTAHSEDGNEIERYSVRKAGQYGVMHIRETSGLQRGTVITFLVDGQTVESTGENIIWDGESRSVQRGLTVHIE